MAAGDHHAAAALLERVQRQRRGWNEAEKLGTEYRVANRLLDRLGDLAPPHGARVEEARARPQVTGKKEPVSRVNASPARGQGEEVFELGPRIDVDLELSQVDHMPAPAAGSEAEFARFVVERLPQGWLTRCAWFHFPISAM